MTTVNTSFTSVAESASLILQSNNEDLTIDLSGTWVGSLQVERALSPDESAWEIFAGPYRSNVVVVLPVGKNNSTFRFRCSEFTSGTAVTVLSDGDAIEHEEFDGHSNLLYRVRQSGAIEWTDSAAATTSALGVIEIATGTETNTGTDATRAVSPDGLDDWEGSAQVVTVGTIASGVWSGTALIGTKVDAATLTVRGTVERSTSAENVTGTDDTVYPTVAGTKEMIDTHATGGIGAFNGDNILISSDDSAGAALTTGTGNILQGINAGAVMTVADDNVAIGTGAMAAIATDATSNNHVAIGTGAMGAAIGSGRESIAIGFLAGEDLTTASRVILIGKSAGLNVTAGSNTIAIGEQALGLGVVTGVDNIAIGRLTGNDLTSGTDNVFIGTTAGTNITVGDENIAIGHGALDAATTDEGVNNNIALGQNAMGAGVVTGADNIAIGQLAGNVIAAGHSNVLIGDDAGLLVTTGFSNICIGDGGGEALVSGDNNILIGTGTTGTASTTDNEITIGNASSDSARIQIDWTILSDARDKTNITPTVLGLDFVNDVTPVSFNMDDRKWYYDEVEVTDPSEFVPEEILEGKTIPAYEVLGRTRTKRQTKPGDGSKMEVRARLGFTSQDIKAALLKHGGQNVVDQVVHSDNPDRLELTQSMLIPTLFKAVQELSAKVDAQEAIIASLTA